MSSKTILNTRLVCPAYVFLAVVEIRDFINAIYKSRHDTFLFNELCLEDVRGHEPLTFLLMHMYQPEVPAPTGSFDHENNEEEKRK